MPSSENQSSSRIPFASFRRGIFSFRTDQVHSLVLEQGSSSNESELKSFEKLVSTRFSDLSLAEDDEFLSISWIRKLLDAFGECQDKFMSSLSSNRELLPKQDKILSDYFDICVKALDICNAARDGIQKLHLWQMHLEIVVSALDTRERSIGEGHIHRARKSLTDLTLAMIEEKDTGSFVSNRNRSFGRVNKAKDRTNHSPKHSRSLSWSVSPSWSASKQLQIISNSFVVPSANETGLSKVVFTMSHVLLFVLWALVAAIPCQDRGLHINVNIPSQFLWGSSIQMLYSQIIDESKKQDRRNSNGLLKEIDQIEKGIQHLSELVDSAQFPLSEEHKEQVRVSVEKLSLVCKTYQTDLGPLERQLRETFRKIRISRAEGTELLGKAT